MAEALHRHLACADSYCTFKVMHYLCHNVSKSMCLAALEGTIGNKSCVSSWSTFCTKSLCEILGKNNCGAPCFALISMEIPKLPAYSSHGMCPHPLNFST